MAEANAKEKGKVIKGVIADCLTGSNGRAKVDAWVPKWMAFPPGPGQFCAIACGIDRHVAGPRTAKRKSPMDVRPQPVTARYLRTPDAAVHVGLSARTLEKHRCYGTGPVYRKLGGRIVYAVADLDAWAELGLRRSTSDPGKGIVHPAKRLDGYTPPVSQTGSSTPNNSIIM